MINIVIGGVPEHFNLPWLKLLAAGKLEEAGVSARWEDYAGGTGAMVSALNEKDAHGNVQLSGSGALGDFLANLLRVELPQKGGKPPRVRADTFGYLQRCWPDASPVDRDEARGAGHKAAEIAMAGDFDGSIAIKRLSDEPYESAMKVVKLEQVAAKTRVMPEEYLKGDHDVSDAFIRYVRPLVGTLPEVGRL